MRFIGTGLLSIPLGNAVCVGEGHFRQAAGGRYVFVDTRRMGDGQEFEPSRGYSLEEPKATDIREAALFIDLGSTRTLGLVIPNKKADIDDLQCLTLKLVDYSDTNDEAPGPFPSQVVLERPSDGISEATWPLSEVRTGGAAAELYNFAAHTLAGAEGRGLQLMASSPKRMIARTKLERTWRTISRVGEPADACRVLQTYQNPYQDESQQEEGLVPSRLVGMQVVELLEQAERMLNSEEAMHAYRVNEVHVTYPPGWLGPVQENYQKLIQTEVDKWARTRALTVKVEMGCSEALGALLFHWYNRRLLERSHGGQTRDRQIRRQAETLAIVDVGGGTSDLLIENVSLQQGHVFQFSPVRWQSEETAGDELVRRMAVEIVLPALIHHPCYAEGEQAALVRYLQDDEHVTEKRRWMRKELQPLAQCVAQVAGRNQQSTTDRRSVREHLEAIIKNLDAVANKTDRGGELSTVLDQLETSILQNASEKIAHLAELVFGSLAQSFASICEKHGCTEVKLSGKAMEYKAVEGIFMDAFHLHGLDDVGLLVGEPIAVELKGFLGCDTVRDSKYATVWGSICKWMIKEKQGHFADGWKLFIKDIEGKPIWYLHGFASRLARNDCTHLSPVRKDCALTISALPQALSYVVCKNEQELMMDQNGAAPVRMFKLAFKNPDMRMTFGNQPKIYFDFTHDGKLQISRVQYGRVVMGHGESDLSIEDLEITPALDYATHAFWLDSGKVELPGDVGGGGGDIPSDAFGPREGGIDRGLEALGHRPPEKPERVLMTSGGVGKADVVVKLGKSKKNGSGSNMRFKR